MDTITAAELRANLDGLPATMVAVDEMPPAEGLEPAEPVRVSVGALMRAHLDAAELRLRAGRCTDRQRFSPTYRLARFVMVDL